MDMLILIKENIRHKKGSFKSIICLMFLISLSVTAIVSLKQNFPRSIREAYERQDVGNIVLNIRKEYCTEEGIREIEDYETVKKVEVIDAIAPDTYEFENGEGGSYSFRISAMNDRVDRLWKEDLSGYEENVLPLGKGEIYIPRGLAEKNHVRVGDRITLKFKDTSHVYAVKGLVEEPICGSVFITLKAAFIGREDFDALRSEREAAAQKDPLNAADLYEYVYITKADDCNLTDNQFSSDLTKNTKMASYASGLLTKSDSLHYQGMMPDIILNIFLSFVIILSVIVFVVMANSISSGIEMNYTDLGILKAQGFDSGSLKLLFLGQYMLAEFIGTVLGMLCSLPVIRYLPRVFEAVVGTKIYGGADILLSGLILLAVLLLSAVFIMLVSVKVGSISPIKAVNGGRMEVYFDSRFNIPIRGRLLSASLAFRQFSAGARRYLSSIAIASLFVFFLMTMTGMTDAVDSESAQRAMGATSEDIDIYRDYVEYSPENTENVLEQEAKIENLIREYTEIEERYFSDGKYMLLNGEKIFCRISEDEETFTVTKGRAPLYKNEILVGQAYAEDMGYKIGDKYTVSFKGAEAEYVISGFMVGLLDAGHFFGMSGDGARVLAEDYIPTYVGFKIKDPEKTGEICKRLEEELPESYYVEDIEAMESSEGELLTVIAYAIKAVIYTISILFALVVVSTVCTKTFVREKTDIGIYKALGFTSGNLRLQFAIRFLIVAFFGIVIGSALSFAFSEKLLSMMLRSMGIVNFVIDYRFMTVFLPAAAVALSYFCFAYMIAGKTKKVEVRSLITE
ncbi:MAG: FtsX-like permease family protein [Lachnospiraceae bacterium]|nr:FtsX-like permease family protein [Lachnospiraceae bacterium]